MESASYEASHYVIFSIIMSLPPLRSKYTPQHPRTVSIPHGDRPSSTPTDTTRTLQMSNYTFLAKRWKKQKILNDEYKFGLFTEINLSSTN
jgi:hypothetical protein